MAFPLDLVAPAAVSDVSDTPAVNLDLLTATARLAFNPDGIPDSLKTLSQWTCWRFKDEGEGKPGKPPIVARTGRYASSKDPATWSTFDAALARFNSDSTIAGLNLILTSDDPIVLLDIDDYGDSPDPMAALALSWFAGTYAEKSPSGGLHVFAIGACPGAGQRKHGIFEVRRTLTVTGERIEGHPETVTAQQDAIDLYHRHCLSGEPLPVTGQQPDTPDFMEMSDAEIDALIGGSDCDNLSMRCPRCGEAAEYPDCEACGYDLTQPPPAPNSTDTKGNAPAAPADFSFVSVGSVDYARRLELALTNAETAALYHGDTGKYGGDRSRAELALCVRLLRFADGDTAVVADWLNGSQCGKWLDRGKKDSDVYRRNTLAAALKGWDGVCFEDKRQTEIDHGRMLAEALFKGRDKAGHSDRTEQPDTGQPEMSGQAGTTGNDRENPLFVPVSRFIGTPAPPQWTVRKWLPASSMAVLFGEPGCGKSFLAVDWCCHVATGLDWNGNRVKQGAVLYIAGEGHYGLKRRFATWQQQHGVIPDTLYISERAVTLDPAGAKTVFEAVGIVPEVPVLIVVDTLSSVIAGDENNAVDMNAFLTVLKKLLVGTAATILVVHHTGHGSKDRARGHSSLKAALDAEFRAERCDGSGTLACTKPKDMEPPPPLSFELTQVELPDSWRDPEEPDEPVTSCIFTVTGNADGGGKKEKKLPASQVIALRALEKAMTEHGGTFKGQFGVHIEDWRKAAYDGGIADGEVSAKKVAFQRVRQALLASGHIRCADDIYWLTDIAKQNTAAMLNTEKRKQQAANADF
jgi:hypothetical protein